MGGPDQPTRGGPSIRTNRTQVYRLRHQDLRHQRWANPQRVRVCQRHGRRGRSHQGNRLIVERMGPWAHGELEGLRRPRSRANNTRGSMDSSKEMPRHSPAGKLLARKDREEAMPKVRGRLSERSGDMHKLRRIVCSADGKYDSLPQSESIEPRAGTVACHRHSRNSGIHLGSIHQR